MAPKVKTRPGKSDSNSNRTAQKRQISAVTSPHSGSIPPPPSAPANIAKPRFNRTFMLSILLALATFAVYVRATRNAFVNFDDQDYVVRNPNIQKGLTLDTFKWAFTSLYATNWHPLTWLSHALDCELFGMNPAGHHFTSIFLHISNSVVLFLLLARVTGARVRSLIVAALFALHPINVESVAWIAERKNVLSMFFLLLTTGAYGWYARRPSPARYMFPFALLILALASKPMVVTIPFLLLLVDFWPLQRVRGVSSPSEAFPVPQYPLWQLAVEKIPLLLLSGASSVITVVAQRSVISTNAHLPFALRVANAIYAYTAYVGKAFWPANLASFYPYEGARIAAWKVFFYAILLLGITAWVWRQRSHLYLPIGWLWFLGSLVPMIGLVQVGNQALADRYAYLPLVGTFCMIVWGTADFVQSRGWNPRPAVVAAGLVLAILSFLTWRQIAVWHSSYDLWANALAKTRDNYLAENYIGTAILFHNFEATGQRYSDEALVHFKNAVRIKPDDPIARMNMAAELHERGQVREAVEQYQLALRLTLDPSLIEKCLLDLGAASGQLGDYAAGRQYYLQVLKMDPGNPIAFENLGKLGMEENIDQLARSAAAKPTAAAYFQLGQAQQAARLIPEARRSYTQAVKLNPKFNDAQKALGALDHVLVK